MTPVLSGGGDGMNWTKVINRERWLGGWRLRVPGGPVAAIRRRRALTAVDKNG